MRKVIRAERRKTTRFILAAAAAAGAMSTTRTAHAVTTRTWNTAAAGAFNWSATANWTGAAFPASGEIASVVPTTIDANNRTLTIDPAAVPATGTLAGFNLDNTGTGSLLVILPSGTHLVAVAGPEQIGISGKGIFEQDGATHTVTGTFTMGVNAASTLGTYNMTAGIFTVAGANAAVIGSAGSATFNQTGGNSTFTGSLTIGSAATGNGLFSLTTGNTSVTGAATIGSNNAGTFTQVSGNATFNGGITLGGTATTSNGLYNLNAGLLNTVNATIGNNGKGTFTQAGGNATFSGTLAIGGTNTGVGLYTMTTGTGSFTASNGNVGDGGVGTLTQSVGNATFSGTLTLGNQATANSNGSYNLSGTGIATINNAVIGGLGRGTFTQSGGTSNINGSLTIGGTNNGIYTLSAGTLNAPSAAPALIGSGGAGTFNQTGGNASFTGGITVGGASGQGLYSMSNAVGTSVAVISDASIGDVSAGTFTQTAGSASFTGALTVGNGGVGKYNLTTGSMTVAGLTSIGVNNTGLFTQNSGNATFAGGLSVGSSAGTGTYTLITGTTTVNTAANIGDASSGTFAQSGGTATFNAPANIGNGTGAGIYTLATGGTANFAAGITLGLVSHGSFSQTGGAASAASLDVGVGAQGSYVLGAGTGTLTVAGTSTIGDFSDGTFSQSGGASTFTGNLTVGNSVFFNGFNTVPVNGLVSLATGTLKAVNVTLGINGGSGVMTQQTSATVNITGTLTLGNELGSAGGYTINSGTATIANANIGGTGGIGVFTQSGGIASFTGTLTVGPGNTNALLSNIIGPGYALSNGNLSVVNGIVGGPLQAGSFVQSGGSATFLTNLIIGQGASTSSLYDLQAGSLTTANATLGAGGTGQITQEGGTAVVSGVNASDSLLLGAVSSDNGTYSMKGGTLTVTATGGIVVGSAGQQDLFDHSAGIVTVGTVGNNRNITIGTNAPIGNTPGGSGTYSLSGTGALTVNGSIFVGGSSSSAGGTGSLSMIGGTGNVTGSIKVWNTPGTSFTMAGGTLTVPTIDTQSNGGFFTYSGGIVNLTGAGGFTVGATGQTTTLVLSPGQFLNNTGATTVQSTGALTFGGGKLTTTTLTSSPGTATFGSGTLNLTASGLTIDAGAPLGNTLAIPTGSSITASGAITNNGTLQLTGGSIGGASLFSNTGFMSGFGSVTGAGGFTNLAFMKVIGGNISLAKTGTLTNSNGGTIDVENGYQLQLAAANLNNSGEIDLNGGFVNTTAGASLINNSDGSITGNGTISTALTNNGSIDIPSNTLTTAAFTNNGSVSLDNTTSRLTTSGTGLTNGSAGFVVAQGRINGPIVNSGTVEVRGGLLTLPGTFTNNASGNLTIDSGATAFITGTLAANAGTINNAGGTLNTNGQSLTNNSGAVITGRGTFRTGGYTNNGQFFITSGTSDVYGGVAIGGSGKIIMSGNSSANFYNAVNISAGGEFRVSTGSTAIFFGPVTGSSLFTGGGTKDFQAGASGVGALTTNATTIVENGASLATSVIKENSLTVGGSVTVAPNGTLTGTVDVGSLSMQSTGQLDLSNNDMIVRNGTIGAWNGTAYTGILGSISTGRLSNWTGKGILTSQSNAKSPTSLTTLAAATAGSIGKAGATFGGSVVNANDVLIMYTYLGDANLDGKINADDYFEIDNNYGKTATSNLSYLTGDFNYDGKVNGDDYFAIDANFHNQSTPFNFANGPDIGGSPALEGISAVPEPTMLGLLPLAGMALARRRRRQV